MPELPDITVYVENLAARLKGDTLQRVRVLNPFVLRTALPPIGQADGARVTGIERLGKRVVLALQAADGAELFLVIHLMIAGRLRWLAAGAKPPAKGALATFTFQAGTLLLTEAGTKRRASIHLVAGRAALQAMDPGGIDVLHADVSAFARQLQAENHTVKRSLTNPRLFSGIGNAYADEILHRARLSPIVLTRKLTDRRDRAAAPGHERRDDRVDPSVSAPKPPEPAAGREKVTAFHPMMAVHGRYGQPCPVCGSPVQRIVHADNETNYCARCQTDGRLLADRALSTLLKASWPKHIDDIE